MASDTIFEEEFEYCGATCTLKVYIDQDMDRWVKIHWEMPGYSSTFTEGGYRHYETDTDEHIEDVWEDATERIDMMFDNILEMKVEANTTFEELVESEEDAEL